MVISSVGQYFLMRAAICKDCICDRPLKLLVPRIRSSDRPPDRIHDKHAVSIGPHNIINAI